MEGIVMVQKNASWFRVENVDVNAVDASTLFAIAEHYGFPALPIRYPDYSKHMEIAKKSEAWERAVRYLAYDKPLGTDMFKYAFLMLYDWFAGLERDSLTRPSIVSRMFNDRTYSVLDVANERFSGLRNLPMCAYYRVCLMLTHAEKLNFPEIKIPFYNHTIHGDMKSWLLAAGLFFGRKVVVWITKRLMEWIANGTPPAPTEYKPPKDEFTAVHGSSTYVLIHDTGGLRVWEQKQPIE
jgi:hypothetical protein